MNRNAKYQPKSGFTLIEVILAVGIFAIVMVSITTAFFAAMRLRQRSSEALENSMPLTRALAVMRKDLQNAVKPGGTLAGNFRGGIATLGASVAGNLNSTTTGAKGVPSVIEGNSASGLDFYTTTGKLSQQTPWAEVQQVNYQLMPPSDVTKPGMTLVRSVARNLLATASEMAQTQKLAENIERIDYSFFDGFQWRDQWDTSSTDTNLPLAVRVTLYQIPPETVTVRQEPVQMLVLLPIYGGSSTNTTTTAGVMQ